MNTTLFKKPVCGKNAVKGDVNQQSALIVATLSSFLAPFMGSSVAVALPQIGSEFGMDAVLLSWVSTGYLLTAAIFLVPFGRAADIYGRKKIFQYGILTHTVASLLAVMPTSSSLFLFFRMLQGFGASMIFGTGVAILMSVYPPGERGKALGINAATVYLGLSLGPFLGGLLTQHLGWRSIFVSVLPLGMVPLYFTLWRLKGEWADAKGEKIDVTGSFIYGLTLIALMYGFSLLPNWRGAGSILMSVLGIATFVRWEMKIDNPVLNIRLFINNRVFAFSNLAALIHYSANFAISFLLSLYLQYVKGLSPQNAGLILIIQPAVMTMVSPFAGILSDRTEPRIVASIGMSITFIGLFSLIFLSQKTTLLYISASQIFLGFGFALFSSPNTNAVMSSVEKKFLGVASATLGTMRLTGHMLSMGIVTLLFSIYLGRVQITPEYYLLFLKSSNVAFLIFCTLCFGGIFASLSRGKATLPSHQRQDVA